MLFGKDNNISLSQSNGVSKEYLLKKAGNDERQKQLIESVFSGRYDSNKDGLLSKDELRNLEIDLMLTAENNKMSKREAKHFLKNNLQVKDYKRDDLAALVNLIESEDDNITNVKEDHQKGTTTVTYKPDKNGGILADEFQVDNGKLVLNSSVLNKGGGTTSTKYIDGDRSKKQEEIVEKNGVKTVYSFEKDGVTISEERKFDQNSNSLDVTKYGLNGHKTLFKYDGLEESPSSLKEAIVYEKQGNSNVETYYGPKDTNFSKPLKSIKNKGLPTETLTKYSYDADYPDFRTADTYDSNNKLIMHEIENKTSEGEKFYIKYDGIYAEENLWPSEQILYEKDGKTIKNRNVWKFDEVGKLNTIIKYDKDGNEAGRIDNLGADGKIGFFMQGQSPDCYLLATINTLATTDKGQELLKNNIEKSVDENGKTIYKVKLPGAEAARKSLGKRLPEDKIHIKGEYILTSDDIQQAHRDMKYSVGDEDVFLYEMAFDKYRHDVRQTVKDNNIDPEDTVHVAGLYGGIQDEEPISGGLGSEALFVLTGKQPDEWHFNGDNGIGVNIDIATREVSMRPIGSASQIEQVEQPEEGSRRVNMRSIQVVASDDYDYGPEYRDISGYMRVSNSTTSESMKNKIIANLLQDAKSGKLENNAPMVSMNIAYGDDNNYGAHEMAIVGINEQEVLIRDSNDSKNKPIKVPMEIFKQSMLGIVNGKL